MWTLGRGGCSLHWTGALLFLSEEGMMALLVNLNNLWLGDFQFICCVHINPSMAPPPPVHIVDNLCVTMNKLGFLNHMCVCVVCVPEVKYPAPVGKHDPGRQQQAKRDRGHSRQSEVQP